MVFLDASLWRSLGLVILAARAHGIAAIDGVALDLEDDEAFRWACEQARNMGYDGKTLIHPKTIDVANEVRRCCAMSAQRTRH
jgi:citrate lyase subunit beta/citryl-CoA lyase